MGSWRAGSEGCAWHCSTEQSPPFWRQPQTSNVVRGGKSDLFALCPEGGEEGGVVGHHLVNKTHCHTAAFSCIQLPAAVCLLNVAVLQRDLQAETCI